MKRENEKNYETDMVENSGGARARRSADTAFCLMCGRAVKLLNFRQAAEYLKTDTEEVAGFAENRRLHLIHNKCGQTMICSASLYKFFQNRQTQKLHPDWTPYKTAEFHIGEI